MHAKWQKESFMKKDNSSYRTERDKNDIKAFNHQLHMAAMAITSLAESKSWLTSYLKGVCNELLQHTMPAVVGVKISYDGNEYFSKGFEISSMELRGDIGTPDETGGNLELFFDAIRASSPGNDEYLAVKDLLPHWCSLIRGSISGFRLKAINLQHRERRKELGGIEKASEILSRGDSIFQALEELCMHLPEAWQYPKFTVVRISYDGKVFTSPNFKTSRWCQQQLFETPDKKEGSIEVYYLRKFSQADEGPFLKEERNFLQTLSLFISGVASRNKLRELIRDNSERLKELKGINTTSELLKKSKTLSDALPKICQVLKDSFQFPEYTAVRITYYGTTYESSDFAESGWLISQPFQSVSNKRGLIEVFYTRNFPEADEGPFLKEERNMLINLAALISGRAVRDLFGTLHKMNTERLKELNAINQTSKIIEEGNSIDEALQRIANLLPHSWQYPRYTACRIIFEGKPYISTGFIESEWMQKEPLFTIDNKKGSIEIAYLKEFPNAYEGPFLLEERNLLKNIGKMVSGYLNSYKGFEIISKKGLVFDTHVQTEAFRKSMVKNKKPLQLYFNQQSLEKYIYLDMMKYKVKHILFVSTLYDAFMLESEDSFFEKFMGEIYQYSLFSLPRITGVSTEEEALEVLETTNFDMVILMAGLDRKAPINLSKKIKEKNSSMPVFLLLSKKSNLKYFEELVPQLNSIDQLFVWNGDSLVIFAMVKSLEDRINVENDTRVGLVRVILIVEDSPLYYSRYLQMLYSIVFDQVQRILPEVEKNELDKISRMRSRPKVLLARNYEEAISIFNKYKDHLLSVISDVEFERAGQVDNKAGVKFLKYARSKIHNLPIVLQSSEEKNRFAAKKIGALFMDKNSDTLLNDLKIFLKNYLGFGSFVFRNLKDEKIAVARSLREFESLLKTIPDESFYVHARENQLSLWLMARGEIQLARTLNPIPLHSMEEVAESRKFFLEAIHRYREEKKRGRIMSFDETASLDERNIVSFCTGSLGGKGRGLAFINVLIYNYDFSKLKSRINISTPITVIIGTNEFQKFISINNLLEKIVDPKVSYRELRQHFFEGKLSASLIRKLKVFINQVEKPIAVRSSSTSEDSITHPFSGVFDTYLIPNDKRHKKKVIELLSNAIKMIYASIFSDQARTYFEAIDHKVEDEKMAIILQELVGSQHDKYYYPHISGVAQSYNYYPVARMKPEEGFAISAIGLGSYVVNGMPSYRFSPAYPKISVYDIKNLLKSTQLKFFALNNEDFDIDLLEQGESATIETLDLDVAEAHGTLTHCASVYNAENDTIEPGLSSYGPRIVDFANILQYDQIPLAETISTILKAVEEAFGSPVEIEFAVDLTPGKHQLPTFYLLQIKPLLTSIDNQNIDFSRFASEKMLLHTSQSLGNGENKQLKDVIFVSPQSFDKLKTIDMVAEIEKLNHKMIREKRKYLLIGPGRWGTRDQFLGIPVNWAQISNARVIVETSLDNFPLDSSLGSHFFHNVTSMNIGYFSVLHSSATDFIKWEVLERQEVIEKTAHFTHVRFEKPLNVIMDGRRKRSVVLFDEDLK